MPFTNSASYSSPELGSSTRSLPRASGVDPRHQGTAGKKSQSLTLFPRSAMGTVDLDPEGVDRRAAAARPGV